MYLVLAAFVVGFFALVLSQSNDVTNPGASPAAQPAATQE
jgi:hypothetical protein